MTTCSARTATTRPRPSRISSTRSNSIAGPATRPPICTGRRSTERWRARLYLHRALPLEAQDVVAITHREKPRPDNTSFPLNDLNPRTEDQSSGQRAGTSHGEETDSGEEKEKAGVKKDDGAGNTQTRGVRRYRQCLGKRPRQWRKRQRRPPHPAAYARFGRAAIADKDHASRVRSTAVNLSARQRGFSLLGRKRSIAARGRSNFWGSIAPGLSWQVGAVLPVDLDRGVDLNAFYDRVGLRFFHA